MFRSALLFAGLFVSAATPAAAQTFTATFENLTPTQQYTNSSGPAGFYENGKNLSPQPATFASGGATFDNRYSTSVFGGVTYESWSRWSYSTVTDTTTAGFGNQYAAYAPVSGAGAGAGGSATYAVGFGNAATVALPAGYRPDSIQLTNTTYAALSMLNGDSFAKKFDTGDYFKLTVGGLNAANASTGSVDFYLADYRSANTGDHYVVSNWTTLSLAGLTPETTKLTFALTSTDIGQFGMNTPAYFAADNLIMSLAPVPEPATTGLIAAGGLGAGWLWRRRKSRAG